MKLILKGKSDFRIPFNNHRAYLQEAFYYESKSFNLNAFVCFKDITYEDKNLGSLKCGLIKKIRIENSNNNDNHNHNNNAGKNENSETIFLKKLKEIFNNNFYNLERNSLLKKSDANNFVDLSIGLKLDRPLYGVGTSNTFSNRNFINFIIGLENKNISFLTKLKYADYDRYNLIAKSFFKYKLDENADIYVDFSYDKKDNKTKYNMGAKVNTENNSVMRFNFDEKNEISQQITMKYDNKIKLNFKYCVSLISGFSHAQQQNQNINPELYLDAKFGMGIEYDVEPKNINSGSSIFSGSNKINNNDVKGFCDLVFESVNCAYNSIAKFIRSIDIY